MMTAGTELPECGDRILPGLAAVANFLALCGVQSRVTSRPVKESTVRAWSKRYRLPLYPGAPGGKHSSAPWSSVHLMMGWLMDWAQRADRPFKLKPLKAP